MDIAGRSQVLERYLKDLRRFPALTKIEEQEIASRLPEAGSGRDDLVRSNLGFVIRVASKYRHLGLSLEDLVSEGNIGLLQAAQHFDPARGTRFITCAVWWIRKAILKALSRHSATIRLPPRQRDRINRMRDAVRSLSSKLGREPGRDEISREMGLSVTRIDAIIQMRLQEVSLEDRIGREEGTSIGESLADRRARSPEAELIGREQGRLIRLALARLREWERTILVERYGLDGGRELSLQEIGAKMGITRERVRQIECRAKVRLRRLLTWPERIAPRALRTGAERGGAGSWASGGRSASPRRAAALPRSRSGRDLPS